MDSSPITAWSHVSAYYTFLNHEGIVMAILIASVAATIGVIASVIHHEKNSEAALEEEHSTSSGFDEVTLAGEVDG